MVGHHSKHRCADDRYGPTVHAAPQEVGCEHGPNAKRGGDKHPGYDIADAKHGIDSRQEELQ